MGLRSQSLGIAIPADLGSTRALWVIRAADMQSVADQPFTKQQTFTWFVPTAIIAIRKSGALGVTCLGGIYTGAAKSGNAIVAAIQSWALLTGVDKMVLPSLAAIAATDQQSSNTLFLSLTTGSLTALTADIFVYGDIVD